VHVTPSFHDPKLLASLQGVLRDFPSISVAILFGSLARAAANPGSDIDLAVQAAPPLPPLAWSELVARLAETSGRPVDLVNLAEVGEPLLGQILKTGVRLVGHNADFGDLIIRHLRETADFLPYRRRILESRRAQWTGM
jgi:predicted nucleotidyltransferase